MPFETYAATETASIASDCSHHRLHLYDDFVTPEFVDDDYRHVPPGTYGAKVLVSVLFSRTLPLIRYEMSDSGAPSAEVCDCGLPFPLIEGVRGRREDVLWLDGTSGRIEIQPGVFGDVLERGGNTGWQVVQERRNLVRVRVVGGADLDEELLEKTMVTALERMGAARPEVLIERVPQLEQTEVGKTPLVKGLRRDGD